jgi:hypothetical protein
MDRVSGPDGLSVIRTPPSGEVISGGGSRDLVWWLPSLVYSSAKRKGKLDDMAVDSAGEVGVDVEEVEIGTFARVGV